MGSPAGIALRTDLHGAVPASPEAELSRTCWERGSCGQDHRSFGSEKRRICSDPSRRGAPRPLGGSATRRISLWRPLGWWLASCPCIRWPGPCARY